ncbi:MAG: transposase [Lentimicrobium sp.]|jgi:REP element-mobilizing transposase RayT|nr:transposase [Lentimicrobium sp.]
MEKYDILESDCFYHIYNRGNNKEDLFLELENYFHFLKLIKTHLAEIADIYAYCLLKNHFHLVLKIKSTTELPEKYHHENRLSQPFSNLFNAYTKAINKRYEREGSLFRVRFKRERITDVNYLRNVIVYVHLNPVKHSFTKDYNTYLHSSFQSLISSKETLLKREEVFELFGDSKNFVSLHQDAFLKGEYEDLD